MSSIIEETGLVRDDLIRVKVRAYNSKGWGPYSEINIEGASIETEPDQMSIPDFDLTTSTQDQITLSWSELTGSKRGGANVEITLYEVYWD
jgi:hypothetical protein